MTKGGAMPFRTRIYKRLSFVLAILFIIIGVYVIINPYEFIVTSIHILSLGLISLGVVDMAHYFFSRENNSQMFWKIAQNCLNIVFGILLVKYKLTAAYALAMLIGVWLFFIGNTKIISSVKVKKYGILNWAPDLVVGGLGVVLGIGVFFTPHIWAVVTAYVIGVALIFLGFVFICEFFIIR